MRTLTALTATLALTLAPACASAPEMLQTEGALRRQVERVVERHDAYVAADPAPEEGALSDSAACRVLVSMPEIRAGSLAAVLLPVLDRHDSYVAADPALDELERETYLASSAGLRSLLARAAPPE